MADPLSRIETATSAYQDKLGRRLSPRNARGQFRVRENEGAMLLWYGDAIVNSVTAAAVEAVREVTHAAAEHARANHPWASRSGDLEEGIFVNEPEIELPDKVKASWGAPSPGLFLELGTVKMPAYPFLRPAADATYGQLPVVIREHMA